MTVILRALSDSHCYSPRFLRLGERASNNSDRKDKNIEIQLLTVILRALLRATRVAPQLRMTVTVILRAF